MTECRWCGNLHNPVDLCRARRVSRRMFCFAASVAALGAALAPACPVADVAWQYPDDAFSVWKVHPGDAYSAIYRLTFTVAWSGGKSNSGLWLAT